jgi:hypothetical protein
MYVAPAVAPEKKKSRIWLIIVLAVGIPLIAIAAVVGLGVLFVATGTDLPINEADRVAVLSVEDLATRLASFEPNAKLEKFTKQRLIDGSYELTYEYDGSKEKKPLYINCVINVERSQRDAAGTFVGMKIGGHAGLALGASGIKLQDRDDLLKWGDESRSAIVTVDGKPGGNFFLARKGKHIFYVLFSGAYIEDPEALADLLMPKLEKLTSYRP